MTYLYRLAGENLKLAEAELNGFLRSQGVDEKVSRNGKLAETDSEPMQLKRLALTHEVSRKIYETDREQPKIGIEIGGSFAIRVENLTNNDVDTKKLERDIGSEIEGKNNAVDLENPEQTIKVYITDKNLVIGELIQNIDRGLFKKRKNQERPFSSPVSLDPVLARVLVNLSGVKPGEYVLDPFCGTGGILIEAGLCGVGVQGLDIQEEMVEGARENLEEYGILNHKIKNGDISNINKKFEGFSAIISDLPYGKASKKTDKAIEDFLKFLENYDGRAVFMYNEGDLGSYSADFSVYVHRSLERFIYVI